MFPDRSLCMSQASLKTHHAVSLGDMQSPLLLPSTALTPLHMIGYEVITDKITRDGRESVDRPTHGTSTCHLSYPKSVCCSCWDLLISSTWSWYWASGNGVGWGCYGNPPGCSLPTVWARARLLPPTWSSTASASLLHVGFPGAQNRHTD